MNYTKDFLVIGGHGFIGSHFCKRLKSSSQSFDIYDIGEPNGDPDKETIEARRKGLPDSIKYKDIPKHIYKYVIHFGSYAGIRSKRPESDYINNNVKKLKKLKKIASYDVFIYISSSSVLGDVETPYSKSKKLAEEFIKTIDRSIIIRPFTVYGKYGRPEMLITKMVKNKHIILNGRPSEIRRRFTYVGDLIKCIFLYCLIGNNNNTNMNHITVNAIGDRSYSAKDLIIIFGNTYTIRQKDPADFTKQTFNKTDREYLCKTAIEEVKDGL